MFHCIEAMRTCLTQDQLVVEWQSSALEVDTWMVEWVPDLDSKPLAISWESVSHARNWTIQQGSQCGPHRFLLCIQPWETVWARVLLLGSPSG